MATNKRSTSKPAHKEIVIKVPVPTMTGLAWLAGTLVGKAEGHTRHFARVSGAARAEGCAEVLKKA